MIQLALDRLQEQANYLKKMMQEIKASPNSPFRGPMLHYAARLFFTLGQLDTATDLVEKAKLHLPPGDPLLEDMERMIQAHQAEINDNFQEMLASENNIRVWVFNPEGIDLFSHNPFKEIDSIRLGGFFSAIQSFCSHLDGRAVSAIDLGTDRFHFYRESGKALFIAALFPKSMPGIDIVTIMKSVLMTFYGRYYTLLDPFSGNLQPFREFKSDFEMILDQYLHPTEATVLPSLPVKVPPISGGEA